MSLAIRYDGFRLYPPYSRKNNKFWVMRANFGKRQVEIITYTKDQNEAERRACQLVRAFYNHTQRQFERAVMESSCLVYFITDGMGRIKIGSSTDPISRLVTLQTGSSTRLELYAVMPGDQVIERGIHAKFHYLRGRGEWFNLDVMLYQFIQNECLLRPEEILSRAKSR